MARFNRFGAVYTDVLAMFPGSDVTDYVDGGASGQTAVEAVLDRITREVAGALSPEVYRQMTQVDCELVVRYATDAQSTATLGLAPVVAGTYHLWQYPNPELLDAGTSQAGDGAWSDFARKPRFGIGELTGYSITASSGAITGLALALGNQLFASYDVNVDSSSFSMPSVKDIVLLGAAAEMGARLYSEGESSWKLVDEYRARYRGSFEQSDAGAMGKALLGDWVPDELRKLNYWTEVERRSLDVKSVRLYRG